MSGRPRHEALRGHVTELLREGFGAPYDEIAHELYLLDNRGRIDTMWGATVIELKSDLRRELPDVQARMPDYLADAARRTHSPRPVTGIATDGATFIGYQLVEGALAELRRYETDPERPNELMAWLEPLLSERVGLAPEARAVAQAFGKGSLTFSRARLTLDALWADLNEDPEVRLKRDLWDGLLREAYGEEVGEDSLFLQHTYLAIVVKTIANRVLDLPVSDPQRLLSGGALADEGIIGAVEADFFDWLLKRPAGADLVRQVAAETARFSLTDVETDVLKVLYESLVDPEERHDLGEYYTPDWLAGRVVAQAMDAPLAQRVLDPACGSGTFLFHALRRLIDTGREAGWTERRIVECCANQVRGLDVHPVAVTLARVTWLLAMGKLLRAGPSRLTVPVFLGDAMQWNLRRFVDRTDVAIDVPGEDRPLRIPLGFAEQQAAFEYGLDELNRGLADEATPEAVSQALRRIEGASAEDADALAQTFAHLQTLYRAGRNGIWTFVFRNLARPVWLSRAEQRADVVVGNPPWIIYRHLSAGMKGRLREALQSYELWEGGGLATQQDMWALFWARAAERYLKRGGGIAFVLPYAALNAPVFAGLRGGHMGEARVRLTGAWALERVWPIFGAQSGSSTTSTCVLFGRREMAGPHPEEIDRWEGRLTRRDADEAEAARALTHSRVPWPRPRTLIGVSPYRSRFRQGATIVPRRFFIVDPAPVSRLGRSAHAPIMQGRAGRLDKHPWTAVEPPRGPIEAEFLRPLALGESVAPFRMLDTVTAVIPLSGGKVLDAAAARAEGHRHLSGWLADVEAKWAAHAKKQADGQPRMTMSSRLDHMRTLSGQATAAEAERVLFNTSGTRLCAARLDATDGIVDMKAYWTSVRSSAEAYYLLAILNSGVVLARIKDLQGIGEAGTRRDFASLVWTLPIPEYDAAEVLHRDLAAAARRAETVAATVSLTDAKHFVAKRRAIRATLAEEGIAAEIEALVVALLPS